MKIILPVAGKGTRLRPHTHFVPKALLPVGTSNILGCIVDDLLHLQPQEFLFVTGYLAETVEEYICSRNDLPSYQFVRQDNPQGLGEAIHLCSPYLEDEEPVLIVLGDTLFEADLQKACASENAVLFTRQVADPSRFGVALVDENQKITRLVEKPQTFVSDLALTGLYYFPKAKALKEALAHIVNNEIRTRGEFQLTDALALMLEKGVIFTSAPLGEWLDCGKKETLLETNEKLLSKLKDANPSTGQVGVKIIPPVFIDRDVELKNCEIGPFVSVYQGAKIENSKISRSLIGKECLIKSSELNQSVLSARAPLKGAKGIYSLGQDAEVEADD